ncbi:carboxypeptidase-like regulatory domain-containing protein [Paraflavitalea speifideaquila]|uniref:carboxypeptidase-like regulatory domain-containing protein n=1 Tax=Paraflavitalea speifideaquila TaxID=3076558 RepID=UPI0028EFB9D3|nr:carboxypeptidase-like regulatory domain-containing protein [Paraflavitalea speifideiaquila]
MSMQLRTNCRFVFLLLLCCVGTVFSLEAQTIKGIVSGKDGQLPGATIQAPAIKRSASTDLNGAFTLSLPGAGKITITISYIGYETKTMDINVHDGVTNAGIIELSPAQSELGQVVIKGTMAPSQAKSLSHQEKCPGHDGCTGC